MVLKQGLPFGIFFGFLTMTRLRVSVLTQHDKIAGAMCLAADRERIRRRDKVLPLNLDSEARLVGSPKIELPFSFGASD